LVPLTIGSIFLGMPVMQISIKKGFRTHKVARFGFLLLAAAQLMLIQFETHPNQWLFYMMGVLMGVGIMASMPFMQAFFSEKIQTYAHEAPGAQNIFLSCFMPIGQLGSFLGPFVMAYVLKVDQTPIADVACLLTANMTNPKTGTAGYTSASSLLNHIPPLCSPSDFNSENAFSSASYLNDLCDNVGSGLCDQICYLSYGTKLFIKDCKLDNVNSLVPIMSASLMTIVVLMSVFYLPKHGQLEVEPVETEDGDDVKTSYNEA